ACAPCPHRVHCKAAAPHCTSLETVQKLRRHERICFQLSPAATRHDDNFSWRPIELYQRNPSAFFFLQSDKETRMRMYRLFRAERTSVTLALGIVLALRESRPYSHRRKTP